jgi:hypothetical protein
MRITKTIETSAGTTAVRELTVGEVRAWMKEAAGRAGGEVDVVGEMLLEDCSIADLLRMSDLTDAAADSMGPSEIRKIADLAKELNPYFFGLRSRLVALGATIKA